MTKYEKFYNWLTKNQNKPVEIAVHAYEFGYYTTWERGFSVQTDGIRDNATGNVINLLYDTDDYDFILDPEKMEVCPEGDCEAGTRNFGIGFKFV